ncbi:TPA: hypothetical protein U2C31_001062 [Streptococcus suis]|uniref:hypothetical protein n=1 Tax=Streptococcus suis TaxID=1307 RepID=UPI000CF3BE31|nr:hypothetical protein [Streptococcus suis]MDW8713683.1 hypothetical protein [Streptococcus suis]NQM34418.1 hypothetical protein [Streptococcus suis]HEM4262104.1 hypothetical protein [Streptococcus suis]HEM5942702.1 hypothetical protein [Streptococcus suis]HEM6012110.1 hypothetical protein [Streptococcus suis]
MSLKSLKKNLARLEEMAQKQSSYFIMVMNPNGIFNVQYKKNASNEPIQSKKFDTVEEAERFLNSLGLSEDSQIVNLCFGEWDDEPGN